ncbi:MAG: hypothetical protein FJW88_04045 [Actinobacteria bacterium]|nr:hypothetical protein [Actinomycetota bacterium]
MEVLVLESDPGAASAAVAQLEAAGHRVLRCHDAGAAPFPCAGLTGGCPLEDAPVDVALTVRAHPHSRPTPLEDGVTCALRHRIPVVVAGRTMLDPFEQYGAESVAGDVVEACEAAVASVRKEHSAIATRALRDTLGRASLPGDAAVAEVRRSGGRLTVELSVPSETPQQVRDTAAVRITGALRAFDPTATGIDVGS